MGFFKQLFWPPDRAKVEAKIQEIEAEMKRVGMWRDDAPPPETRDVHTAFGQGTLAFEEWLQFIFLPRVRERISEGGKWPRNSQVGGQAFREWRMWGAEEQYDHLLDLLCEFDAMF